MSVLESLFGPISGAGFELYPTYSDTFFNKSSSTSSNPKKSVLSKNEKSENDTVLDEDINNVDTLKTKLLLAIKNNQNLSDLYNSCKLNLEQETETKSELQAKLVELADKNKMCNAEKDNLSAEITQNKAKITELSNEKELLNEQIETNKTFKDENEKLQAELNKIQNNVKEVPTTELNNLTTTAFNLLYYMLIRINDIAQNKDFSFGQNTVKIIKQNTNLLQKYFNDIALFNELKEYITDINTNTDEGNQAIKPVTKNSYKGQLQTNISTLIEQFEKIAKTNKIQLTEPTTKKATSTS